MDRIDPFSHGLFPQSRRDNRKVEKKKKAGKTFRSFLQKDQEADAGIQGVVPLPGEEADSMEQAIDRIFNLGEKLKKNPNREMVLEYKGAVASFIRYVLDHNLVVEENSSGANILKRKRFTLVKVIDEKLDRLAAGVMQNQRDQLDILRRIDEIHGLIIDLVG